MRSRHLNRRRQTVVNTLGNKSSAIWPPVLSGRRRKPGIPGSLRSGSGGDGYPHSVPFGRFVVGASVAWASNARAGPGPGHSAVTAGHGPGARTKMDDLFCRLDKSHWIMPHRPRSPVRREPTRERSFLNISRIFFIGDRKADDDRHRTHSYPGENRHRGGSL